MTGLTADDSNLGEAPRSFEEAVPLDPSFVLAWVYLFCADSTAYWRGIAHAGVGNGGAAVSEGQKGMALQPTSKDPFEGPEQGERMAQIYALLGNADEAMPILKCLLHTSGATGITPNSCALIRFGIRFATIRAFRN